MGITGKKKRTKPRSLAKASLRTLTAGGNVDGADDIVYNPSRVNNAKNPLRYDPTRTLSLRKHFIRRINKQFSKLKSKLYQLIVKDDAFGLTKKVHNEQRFKFTEGKVKLDTGQVISVIYVNPVINSTFKEGTLNMWSDAAREAAKLARQATTKARLATQKSRNEKAVDDSSKTAHTQNKPDRDLTAKDFERTAYHHEKAAEIHSSAKQTLAALEHYNAAQLNRVAAQEISKSGHNTKSEGGLSPVDFVKYLKTQTTVYNAGSKQVTTSNADYSFLSTSQQIEAFQNWLELQLGDLLEGTAEEELWRRYITDGYKKGVGRAWDDTKGNKDKLLAPDEKSLDFYLGTREQFLRDSFAQAVSIERVKVLASRTFDDLENVTHDMSTRMSRTLTDGLVQGKSVRDIAKDLDDDLDIGRNRAELIAQTELIRAHAEGQLDAFENMGVEELVVDVEFLTGQDNIVCSECASLEGTIFTVDDARGVIPVHPNCRCCFIPVLLGMKQNRRYKINSTFNFNPYHNDKGRFSSGNGLSTTSNPTGTEQPKLPITLVKNIADVMKQQFEYHGQVNIYDKEGRQFEKGGLKWREGANCNIQNGEVNIYAKNIKDINSLRHIMAHEFMHGMFQKVLDKQDSKTNDYIKQNKDKLAEDDGITKYSEAYWRDYKDGKCTYDLAVHETLAEIQGIDASTAIVKGSDTFKGLYKLVKSDHKSIVREKKDKDRTSYSRNESRYTNHNLYLDENFNPVSDPNNATYLRWWKLDGTNGWATVVK